MLCLISKVIGLSHILELLIEFFLNPNWESGKSTSWTKAAGHCCALLSFTEAELCSHYHIFCHILSVPHTYTVAKKFKNQDGLESLCQEVYFAIIERHINKPVNFVLLQNDVNQSESSI